MAAGAVAAGPIRHLPGTCEAAVSWRVSRSFNEAREALFRAYTGARYDEALAIAREVRGAHPSRVAVADFWIACMQCRLGRPEDALQTLRTCLDEGLWLDPARLRKDPDLAPIRERPELRAVIAESERRRERQQRQVVPELRVRAPEQGGRRGEPPPLLMALHMHGGDADQTLEHWRSACRSGVLVAAAQGTVLVGPQQYAWGEDAQTEIAAHVDSLTREHLFDPERVVLAGASQGAGVAVGLALRQRPVASRGFISVAGVPPDDLAGADLAARADAAASVGVRGVFITGEDDFARERIVETYTALRDHGLAVRLERIPGLGHAYPEDFEARLEAALEYLLG